MSMYYGWQIPISMRGRKGWERAHYMPIIKDTDKLYVALCGHKFNPGFAIPDDKMPRCFNCQRRLMK